MPSQKRTMPEFSGSSEDEEDISIGGMAEEMARREVEGLKMKKNCMNFFEQKFLWSFSEEFAKNAPCIRLVEFPANRLHIVTIAGARVGFAPKMDIQLMRPRTVDEQILTVCSVAKIFLKFQYFFQQDQPLFRISYANNSAENPTASSSSSGYQLNELKVPLERDGHRLEVGGWAWNFYETINLHNCEKRKNHKIRLKFFKIV